MTARGLGDNDPLAQPARRPRVQSPIPARAVETEEAPDPAESGTGGPGARKNSGWKAIPKDKQQLSLYLRRDLVERMRNAVVATWHLEDGPDNLSDLASRAFEAAVAELETEHNEGRPFPQRPRGARVGHPL